MPNGMKSGSGDDPFAEDDDVEDDPVDDVADTDKAAGDPFDEQSSTEEPGSASTTLPGIPDHPADESSRLPWIHRRDGVKDDRDHKTIHYTEHTVKRERRELRPALEEQLGDDVELTDAREAAYLVGMDHLDEVADVLREWGYDIE
ncbi:MULTISPECIES: hypothetical protein [Halorubrum]|jgi:hypothetical protein|nr:MULTISPECIES: hypothetical protein [Halorubrum]MDB2272511.1 hypothetical protein [Halorubrum ezzemoulense]MDB9234951.1 hypothetical protein [Halorubrum ezzemoulense]MDB9253912.1 hypothetical protein [Halorubrum ezzemoulense]MDB9257106.1 hypothetical protein [Halorubrum ezzemoulense]MDB9277916.1 hypothetical protein [Halorubrum ezzemoulense]